MAEELQTAPLPSRASMTTATEANSTTLDGIKKRLRIVRAVVSLCLVLAIGFGALGTTFLWALIPAGVFAMTALAVGLFGGLPDEESIKLVEKATALVERMGAQLEQKSKEGAK